MITPAAVSFARCFSIPNGVKRVTATCCQNRALCLWPRFAINSMRKWWRKCAASLTSTVILPSGKVSANAFLYGFQPGGFLCGTGQKAFIAELMPKHPIYTRFLSEEAQAVIGEVHPQTAPARAVLERKAFAIATISTSSTVGRRWSVILTACRLFVKPTGGSRGRATRARRLSGMSGRQ